MEARVEVVAMEAAMVEAAMGVDAVVVTEELVDLEVVVVVEVMEAASEEEMVVEVMVEDMVGEMEGAETVAEVEAEVVRGAVLSIPASARCLETFQPTCQGRSPQASVGGSPVCETCRQEQRSAVQNSMRISPCHEWVQR